MDFYPFAFILTIIYVSACLSFPFEVQQDTQQPRFLIELVSRGNKTYYAEILSNLNWVNARSYCINLNMSLADFPSTADTNAVSDRLVEFGVTTESFWINADNFPSGVGYYWRNNGELAFNGSSTSLYAGTLRISNSAWTYNGVAPTTLLKVICQKVKGLDCRVES